MPEEPTRAEETISPPPPERIDALCAVMGDRLASLMRTGGASEALLGGLLADLAESRLSPKDRFRILLFTATGLCACRASRITTERLKELLDHEWRGTLEGTPEGRLIGRHRMLLAALLWRGCSRRGEFMHT